MVANRRPKSRSTRLLEADPVERPVDEEDLADQSRPRHGPPNARVARLRTVVAHEEVVAHGDDPGARRLVVATRRLDVRLLQELVVDVDDAVALGNVVTGQAD